MPEFSDFCVYTIRHRDLLEADAKRTWGSAKEGKRWVTAQRLFDEAKADKSVMPIVFGDALGCRRLLYWAILTDVKVRQDEGTEYTFKQVRRLRGHLNRELVLRSTGKKIAPKYIRPYAICVRPDFVR